jgi:hypothetical protein
MQVSGDDEDLLAKRATKGSVVPLEVFIDGGWVNVPFWHHIHA